MLCVVEPERFLPVLKYTAATDGGGIAKLVFDLDLPACREGGLDDRARSRSGATTCCARSSATTSPTCTRRWLFLAWAKTRPALARS